MGESDDGIATKNKSTEGDEWRIHDETHLRRTLREILHPQRTMKREKRPFNIRFFLCSRLPKGAKKVKPNYYGAIAYYA